MRKAVLACLSLAALGLIVLHASTAAAQSDVVRIFGRDPGSSAAHACFARSYTKAHLGSHPDQNVTRMVAYVGKNEGDDTYYPINLQVKFRQISKPFQVSGTCNESEDGRKNLTCGIDCDGGMLSVRVKNEQSILVEIPNSVRLYDPSATDEYADLPQGARFGSDDKLFRLDRTDLSECLPIILDQEIKAKVASGVITD